MGLLRSTVDPREAPRFRLNHENLETDPYFSIEDISDQSVIRVVIESIAPACVRGEVGNSKGVSHAPRCCRRHVRAWPIAHAFVQYRAHILGTLVRLSLTRQ